MNEKIVWQWISQQMGWLPSTPHSLLSLNPLPPRIPALNNSVVFCIICDEEFCVVLYLACFVNIIYVNLFRILRQT